MSHSSLHHLLFYLRALAICCHHISSATAAAAMVCFYIYAASRRQKEKGRNDSRLDGERHVSIWRLAKKMPNGETTTAIDVAVAVSFLHIPQSFYRRWWNKKSISIFYFRPFITPLWLPSPLFFHLYF